MNISNNLRDITQIAIYWKAKNRPNIKLTIKSKIYMKNIEKII